MSKPCHAKVGLMPHAASVAPDQPAKSCGLARSYSVSYKCTQGFMVSLADSPAPAQTARLRRLS
ncbi:hypothetical protein DPMN_060488 [Dreissena polymorpha]|uniref:Uncharacterized protein n=1 Tax=Dreissena polymorpha TaxID=45954 RepID=A0A9D4HHL2_DREPO|nr:hypothetical protein DPMN_060488 [Dreissena polymorpha]